MNEYKNWLKKNNYSKNTIRTYLSVLRQYEGVYKDIRLIKKKILSYSDSPNTCILHYNVICAFMRWNNDKRISALKTMKLPQCPIVYRDVFSKKYLIQKTKISSRDSELMIKKKMTIRFLYETGMRACELGNIKEVKDDYLIVVGKGKKERAVFYNCDTFIKFYPFEYSTKTLRLWVKEILGEAYSPHSIRRSFATHMLINGASPKMVQIQLGHSKIETTFSYLNLSLNENQSIYNRYF